MFVRSSLPLSAQAAITVEKVIFKKSISCTTIKVYFVSSIGHLLTSMHKGAMGPPALSCAF